MIKRLGAALAALTLATLGVMAGGTGQAATRPTT